MFSSSFSRSGATSLRPTTTSISTPPPPLAKRRSMKSSRYARNGFEVHIVGATSHGSDGYVRIDHDQTYSIMMSNANPLPCDVKVEVDGKSMGTYRIGAFGSTTLEGPPEEARRFTFFEAGSEEALYTDIVGDRRQNGEIRITFTPHSRRMRRQSRVNRGKSFRSRGSVSFSAMAPQSLSVDSYAHRSANAHEGATGLSGYSDQTFRTVGSVPLDRSRSQTIGFRLISTGNHVYSDRHLVDPWEDFGSYDEPW